MDKVGLLVVYQAEGLLGVIRDVDTTTGSGKDVWALAMTAYFGPVGIHESRMNNDGVPSADTLARFPQIAEQMERVREELERRFGL